MGDPVSDDPVQAAGERAVSDTIEDTVSDTIEDTVSDTITETVRDRNDGEDASHQPIPAILLCGGRGSRLLSRTESRFETVSARGTVSDTEPIHEEKPLVSVGGESMIDRVHSSLRAADLVGPIHAVASPNTPRTLAHLRSVSETEPSLVVHTGAGDGYVSDLRRTLETTGTPAFTVGADLPLLEATHVDATIVRSQAIVADPDRSLTVCVPVATKRRLGVSADTTFEEDGRSVAATGVNVVGSTDDDVWVVDDPALAVNVNRPGDLAVARELVA